MTSGAPTRMAAWLESAWLARYLERQLDGEELAWFEAYLLDKPELLGMVEADNALRDGLAITASSVSIRPAKKSVNYASLATPRGESFRRQWFALAASLVCGLGLGWLGQQTIRIPPRNADIVVNPAHLIFDTMRGDASSTYLEYGDMDSPYTVVDVAIPPGAEHVVLRHSGAKEIELVASADGFATFLMRSGAPVEGGAMHITYELDGRIESRTLQIETNGRVSR